MARTYWFGASIQQTRGRAGIAATRRRRPVPTNADDRWRPNQGVDVRCHHRPRIQIQCLTYPSANNARGWRDRGSTKDAAPRTPRFTSRRRGVNCAECSYEQTPCVLNAAALAPWLTISCASMTTPTLHWFGQTFKQCVTRATTRSRVVRRTINQHHDRHHKMRGRRMPAKRNVQTLYRAGWNVPVVFYDTAGQERQVWILLGY